MLRMEPPAGQIWLLVAPSGITALLSEMIAELTFKSRVMILDGGNRFDGYGVARALRRRTSDLDAALHKVLLSRAFTCYQMLAMLSSLPTAEQPIIVLDMLATFLDENVRLSVRQNLLADCLLHLQRLSQAAPVIIWTRRRSKPNNEDTLLLDPLLETAQKVWRLENPQPQVSQPSLF